MSNRLFKCLDCQVTLAESSHLSVTQMLKHLDEVHNIKAIGEEVQNLKHWQAGNESVFEYTVNQVTFQVIFK